MIRLGVNIDHVATLREVRKAKVPNLIMAMKACERGGADQITVHLREDRRHIQDRDLRDLMKESRLPINLEMALVPEMLEIAKELKPASITLVPEKRAEMTTESGLNLESISTRPHLDRVTKIYAFIDADLDQVRRAHELKVAGIEFHTGPYARAFERQNFANELEELKLAAIEALHLGLEVKVGHGLDLENVGLLLDLPGLSEMNIGHSIVARAIFVGLETAVAEMKNTLS